MVSTAGRSVSEPLDPGAIPMFDGELMPDVPTRLASRISDLWASEERLRRQKQTEFLLREAAQSTQD